jgi:uncharacterized phage protein gp47/JayE
MGKYITEQGLVRPTLYGLLNQERSDLKTAFGVELNLAESSPLGHMTGIHSAGWNDAWDAIEELYANLSINTATGIMLDNLCQLIGIYRIAPTNATAKIAAYTTEDSAQTIPIDSIVKNSNTGAEYQVNADASISKDSGIDFYFNLPMQAPAELRIITFTVTDNGGVLHTYTYSYGGQSDTTVANIAADLKTKLAQLYGNLPVLVEWWQGGSKPNSPSYHYDSGDSTLATIRFIRTLQAFQVDAESDGESSIITKACVGSIVDITASAAGTEQAIPGALNTFENKIDGIDLAVFNFEPGVAGTALESDEDLRSRALISSNDIPMTDNAITNALLTIPGISMVNVRSNRSNVPVDSNGTLHPHDKGYMAPHSFTAVIIGTASRSAIAQTIYENMPPGIESNGNEKETIPDGNGGSIDIYWESGSPIYVQIKVQFVVYSEEVVNVDKEAMKAAIVDWTRNEWLFGEDIIPQRLFVPIYSVPGVGRASVAVYVTENPNEPLLPQDDTRWDSSGDTVPVITGYYPYTTTNNIMILEGV